VTTLLFRQRKIYVVVEETHHDFVPSPSRPPLKGAVAAVVNNPFVGDYVDDLSPATEELHDLGHQLGELLVGHLGGDPHAIDSYGKGTIVGADGEIEHGAMWHIPGGGGMRAALGKGEAIVPSTKLVACGLTSGVADERDQWPDLAVTRRGRRDGRGPVGPDHRCGD